MRLIFALIVTIVCVSAFSPASRMVMNKGSMKLAMAKEGKSAALPFMDEPANLAGMAGNLGFDPAGFSNSVDVRWLREAELKHARICMLAIVGWVTSEVIQLPGDIYHVSPIAAHDAAVQSHALIQVNLWISIFEIVSAKAVMEMFEGSGREAGDFAFDPLKLSEGKSDAVKDVYKMKELQNGRLAMLAFSGIVTQAVLTGKGFPYV